jgi:hypothetical protein
MGDHYKVGNNEQQRQWNSASRHTVFILLNVVAYTHSLFWRSSKSNDKRLYAVFVDFQGAYVTVDRQRMWEHLHATVGMPPFLLG